MQKHLAVVAALLLGSAAQVAAQEDVKAAPACRHCGMDREKFAASRMVVTYDDGSSAGTCSIRCTAVDLATNLDKAPRSVQVADMATKALVDADKAHWVVVTGKPGVMTRNGKWAFADLAAAEAYAKANGGAVVSYDEAMRSAYLDMHQDNVMLREKRKAMRQRTMERPAGEPKPAEHQPAGHPPAHGH